MLLWQNMYVPLDRWHALRISLRNEIQQSIGFSLSYHGYQQSVIASLAGAHFFAACMCTLSECRSYHASAVKYFLTRALSLNLATLQNYPWWHLHPCRDGTYGSMSLSTTLSASRCSLHMISVVWKVNDWWKIIDEKWTTLKLEEKGRGLARMESLAAMDLRCDRALKKMTTLQKVCLWTHSADRTDSRMRL